MAATYNIKTLTGSDVSVTFTFSGLDLVGTMTATAHMRRSAEAEVLSAIFTTAINTSNETVTLTLEGTKTSDLAPGDYVYDVKIEDSSDNSSVIYIKGKVTLEQAVTR